MPRISPYDRPRMFLGICRWIGHEGERDRKVGFVNVVTGSSDIDNADAKNKFGVWRFAWCNRGQQLMGSEGIS